MRAARAVVESPGLSSERWTHATPYGVFFNDCDPNFLREPLHK